MNFKKLSKWISFTLVLTLVISLVIPTGGHVQAATIKLNKSSVNLGIGDTFQLKVTGAKSKVTWSTNKKSVVTVNSEGLITGIKAGYTDIIADVNGKELKCTIIVYKPSFKRNYVTLGLEEQTNLIVNYIPQKYKKAKITWETANSKIATIDNTGKVTGKSIGVTKVTASFGEYTITGKINVNPSKQNINNAINDLNIEYGEVDDHIVCVLTNNSKIDLTFSYDLAFYDSSNNLVSLSGNLGVRDGFFAGDSKVFSFEKTNKEYSYYKIRFSDVWGYYYYINQKAKVDVKASDPYDFTYSYTEYIDGFPISKTVVVKLMDLNADNCSGNRVILEANIIYYKADSIVSIQNFNMWYGNIDVGVSVLKNPLSNRPFGGTVVIPEYDNYKIIYSAKSLKQ